MPLPSRMYEKNFTPLQISISAYLQMKLHWWTRRSPFSTFRRRSLFLAAAVCLYTEVHTSSWQLTVSKKKNNALRKFISFCCKEEKTSHPSTFPSWTILSQTSHWNWTYFLTPTRNPSDTAPTGAQKQTSCQLQQPQQPLMGGESSRWVPAPLQQETSWRNLDSFSH